MRTFFERRRSRVGYTLVEMLATISIILILATITFFTLSNAEEAARKATATRNAQTLNEALERYKVAGGNMDLIANPNNTLGYDPTSQSGVQAVIESLRTTNQLSKNIGGPFLTGSSGPQFTSSGWRVIMVTKVLQSSLASSEVHAGINALQSTSAAAAGNVLQKQGPVYSVYFDVANDDNGQVGVNELSGGDTIPNFTPIGISAGTTAGTIAAAPTLSSSTAGLPGAAGPTTTTENSYYNATTTP